jgi:hypothetical protein
VGVESGMALKSTPTHSHLKVGVKRPIPMGETTVLPLLFLKWESKMGVVVNTYSHFWGALPGPPRSGSVRLDELRGDGSDDDRIGALPH